MKANPLSRRVIGTLLAASLLAPLGAARAQSGLSEASALSALPIAVSVAAPVMLLSAGAFGIPALLMRSRRLAVCPFPEVNFGFSIETCF